MHGEFSVLRRATKRGTTDTLPLVGRVDRRSEAEAIGVGVDAMLLRSGSTPSTTTPTPAASRPTLPTRGRVQERPYRDFPVRSAILAER